MKTIRLEIDLEYDEDLFPLNELTPRLFDSPPPDVLTLYSEDVGDDIGTVRVLRATKLPNPDEPKMLIDTMLAAQTRFAQAWRDGVPLTDQQKQDEFIRDRARDTLLKIIRVAEMGTTLPEQAPSRKVAKVKGGGQAFYCPGCERVHTINTVPELRHWSFNGDYQKPTFYPTIHRRFAIVGTKAIAAECHCLISAGKIEFLKDCSHSLAGVTLDLPDWPHGPGEWDRFTEKMVEAE